MIDVSTIGKEKYKITLFSSVGAEELAEKLCTIRFNVDQKNGDVYWKGDNGEFFVISPFRQPYRYGLQGYRVYSNYPISTIMYLFKGAFGWVDVKVTGIEYEIHYSKSKSEYLRHLMSHPSITTVDSRGIFSKQDVIIVLLNDKVVLQRRVNLKKIREEFKKIEDVKDTVFPNSHDLFSLLSEVEAV